MPRDEALSAARGSLAVLWCLFRLCEERCECEDERECCDGGLAVV